MGEIDPSKPLPLYHQIAEVIRTRIGNGRLRVGDSLEPMRRAAESFGVHLHTVRHAYLALSREGLVAMQGARGTRVISDEVPVLAQPDAIQPAAEFLQRVIREAATRYGLTAADLAARLAESSSVEAARPPAISIVECSDWQCRRHREEILALWDVEVRPHVIDDDHRPETEIVVATWFHYNDVRRRWPELLHRVEFLTIRPDLQALEHLEAATWWVVERDEATIGAVAGDLLAQIGDGSIEIRNHVTSDPAAALGDLPGNSPILFSPRVFADLDESARKHERAFELRYVFDTEELSALARRHQWRARSGATQPRAVTPAVTP